MTIKSETTPIETSGTNLGFYRNFTFLCFCLTLVSILVFPLMTDEAYYLDWSRRAQTIVFGYFDHPPFVSWQASFSRPFDSFQWARLGVWLASIATFVTTWKIGFLIWENRTKAWLGALLAQLTIGGVANSILLTPDSGLALFWSLAIHEGIVALSRDSKRWLTTGLVTGLGLLAKYTMVLIGPVFLIGLVLTNPKQLRSPWPYLGGLVAGLIFLPNIYWNSQNHWSTFRFQFGHGFSVSQAVELGSSLPLAKASEEGTEGRRLFREFETALNGEPGFEETKRLGHHAKSFLEQAWMNIGDFLGGVVAIWGVVFILVSISAFQQRAQLRTKFELLRRNKLAYFLLAGAFWPLGFFALLSPFSKIEANWAAMHIVPLAVVLSGMIELRKNGLITALLCNFIVVCGLILVFKYPFAFPFGRENRILSETSGYDKITELLKERVNGSVLAVDSYQLKSALSARARSLKVIQWPGMNRPSEYTLGGSIDKSLEQQILLQNQFLLLSQENIPPTLDGFDPILIEGIRSCSDGTIGLYDSQNTKLPCVNGLRDWWLVTYQRKLM